MGAFSYAVTKFLGKDNSQPDYDDDIYDYPDPYDTEESVDFEIDDEALADVEKTEDAAEDIAEKVEDAAADIAEEITED